jgi:hypothetical protein
MLATAVLHGIGIGFGLGIARFGRAHSPRVTQFGGAVLAVAGLGILTGVI